MPRGHLRLLIIYIYVLLLFIWPYYYCIHASLLCIHKIHISFIAITLFWAIGERCSPRTIRFIDFLDEHARDETFTATYFTKAGFTPHDAMSFIIRPGYLWASSQYGMILLATSRLATNYIFAQSFADSTEAAVIHIRQASQNQHIGRNTRRPGAKLSKNVILIKL